MKEYNKNITNWFLKYKVIYIKSVDKKDNKI